MGRRAVALQLDTGNGSAPASIICSTMPAHGDPLSEDNRWVNAQRIEVSGGQGI